MIDTDQKLAAARTRLVLDKPFLGALVLRLPLIEARGDWCDTSATDARALYYNAEYIAQLSLSQTQFVLAHEALHCGLSHFARREHRDLHRWNLACDYAVNPLLVEDGLELPPEALFNEAYAGMSAEEIYPLIETNSNDKTQDQHLYDQSDSCDIQPKKRYQPENNKDRDSSRSTEASEASEAKPMKCFNDGSTPRTDHSPSPMQKSNYHPNAITRPTPLSAQERERLSIQWQQRLVGAAQQAVQSGKMNRTVARMINHWLRSSIPWRTVLARFMSGASRTDYNLLRPTQRRSGDAILPSLYARQTNVLVAVDTSGSIEQDELTEFFSEINAIKSLVNAQLTLLACDSSLDQEGPWVFDPWEPFTLPKTLAGGGGTDFNPVFDWINQQASVYDLVVYFTDALGKFPERPPNTETLWLIKGSAEVPWGQRIQLN